MEYDKLEFVEAVEELAGFLGLEIPYEKRPHFNDNGKQVGYQTKRNLYELMQEIAKFYQQQLPLNIPAQSYLQQRGLSAEIIERFQIGYVPNAMDTVYRQFGKTREEQQKLFDLGMLSRNDRGNVYDKFRNRIMFPIRDRRGRTVAFGGRVLTDEKPKYLNSPETITYHKGSELYGLFEALQADDSPQKLLVVEGYMDVVALAQFGVNYAVASLGTSTTSEQIQLLFRSTEQVICCYDGDRAGRDAAWRALENALPYMEDGRQLKFIFLPDDEDPDSFIRQYGKQGFEEYIEKAQSLSEFLFAHLTPKVDFSSKESKTKLAALGIPLIEKIPSKALRMELRHLFAKKLAIVDPAQLESLLPEKLQTDNTPITQKIQFKRTPMRILIALLLQNPELVKFVPDLEPLKNLDEPGYDLLAELTALCREKVGISAGQLLEHWRDTKQQKTLEKLLAWNHLIEDDKIEDTFRETLRYFYLQLVDKRIHWLIAKDRAEGLDLNEKKELSHLLVKKQEKK